ncbi:hypothetical protein GCM10009760_30200 [Kitasatospora kazusensis]|uniref:Bacterial transcriptional activator domain-containing protein n=1 Tax=Kitasatospora kazusensis TaxID=407974 RepID=A0ABP5L974_9ACTN
MGTDGRRRDPPGCGAGRQVFAGAALGAPRAAPAQAPHPPGRSSVQIDLLGGFRLLVADVPVPVPAASERLLAFAALHRHAMPRAFVAGTLWPETSDCRALANLRSVLARLGISGRSALEIRPGEICLAQRVAVDLHRARELALHVLDPATPGEDLGPAGLGLTGLPLELLPGWYDDWILAEAENWRQLSLQTLEVLSGKLVRARQFAGAVTAASAAVRADPLRESAQAALVRAHLAEGNQSEAVRAFRRYECLLRDELGLRPTALLSGLVTGLCGDPHPGVGGAVGRGR